MKGTPMGKLIDRTGHVYGRLRVLGRFESGPASKGARTKWVCACDCGKEKIATGHELAAGHTTSCGCRRAEELGNRVRSHGMARTKTYRSWQSAKERCYNQNHVKYPAYGAAGISMCERWRHSFEAFLEDMGTRPSDHTLDRVDQTKGYEPGNCRWATAAEQSINKGSTRSYRWRGNWMTVRQIADIEGVPNNTLRKLVRQFKTIQAAVAETKRRKRNFRSAA